MNTPFLPIAQALPIVRVWSGSVPPTHASGFLDHLLATGVAEARAIDGCLGGTILRRPDGDRVHFTLLTLWRDAEAVGRFARGTTAVLYPGDEAFGLIPDPLAVHFDLVHEERSPG